jgi:hypothetical protein
MLFAIFPDLRLSILFSFGCWPRCLCCILSCLLMVDYLLADVCVAVEAWVASIPPVADGQPLDPTVLSVRAWLTALKRSNLPLRFARYTTRGYPCVGLAFGSQILKGFPVYKGKPLSALKHFHPPRLPLVRRPSRAEGFNSPVRHTPHISWYHPRAP